MAMQRPKRGFEVLVVPGEQVIVLDVLDVDLFVREVVVGIIQRVHLLVLLDGLVAPGGAHDLRARGRTQPSSVCTRAPRSDRDVPVARAWTESGQTSNGYGKPACLPRLIFSTTGKMQRDEVLC